MWRYDGSASLQQQRGEWTGRVVSLCFAAVSVCGLVPAVLYGPERRVSGVVARRFTAAVQITLIE